MTTSVVRESVPSIRWRSVPYEVTGAGVFDRPGQDTVRLATLTAYSLGPIPVSAKYQNYTYDLTFSSPRLRCGSVPREHQQDFDDTLSASHYGSRPVYYNATVKFTGEYANLFVRTPLNNFSCQPWKVSYDTTFNYKKGIQSVDVRDVRFLERLPQLERATPLPHIETEYVTEGYKSWFYSLTDLLIGRMDIGDAGDLTVTTNVLRLGVAGCPDFKTFFKDSGGQNIHSTAICPGGALEHALENLSQNFTFSLFSYGPAL